MTTFYTVGDLRRLLVGVSNSTLINILTSKQAYWEHLEARRTKKKEPRSYFHGRLTKTKKGIVISVVGSLTWTDG